MRHGAARDSLCHIGLNLIFACLEYRRWRSRDTIMVFRDVGDFWWRSSEDRQSPLGQTTIENTASTSVSYLDAFHKTQQYAES